MKFRRNRGTRSADGVQARSAPKAGLLYSARTLPEVIYRDELDAYHDGAQVSYTLTRSQPPGWTGYGRRIDAALLEARLARQGNPLAFICGQTSCRGHRGRAGEPRLPA